jgi:hypothetical protein
MSRETLKSFLSSKNLPGDSISYTYNQEGKVPTNSGVDLGVDAVTGEELLDLDTESRGLLGDYLNYITENSSNIFKIAAGNERATASRRGETLPVADEQGAESVFVEQGTTYAQNMNSYSNSGKFDSAGKPISEFLDKTGLESDAHKLLNEIEGRPLSKHGNTLVSPDGDASKPAKAVQSVLLKNNRFTNVTGKTAFATKGVGIDDFESKDSDSGTLKYERDFGKANINNDIVSLDELKSLGASLLLKSSGFDTGATPSESGDISDIDAEMNSANMFSANYAPNSFKKVGISNLRSKNAKGSPESSSGESIRAGRGEYVNTDPDAKNAKSFGSIYNQNLHFHGKNRKLHRLQAAIACIALSKITKDFMRVITDIIKFRDLKLLSESDERSANRERTYDGPGPYIKGVFNQVKSFELDLIKKLALVQTNFPYPDCFEKGIEVFFGNDLSPKKVAKSEFISQFPGFWLSVSTSILKSFDQLNSAFSDLSSFDGNSSEKISLIVDIVKSNKLVQFANVAATVGDVYFKNNNGLIDSVSKHNPYDVDKMKTTPGTRVSKSRENDGDSSLSLAWRQGSVPSMYILPRNVIRASIQLNNVFQGSNPARSMIGSGLVKNTYIDRSHDGSFNRIPNDVAKRLEDELDAEYVPFYLQDLRTNEIISFHAFLTQLTDTISPTYTDVTGYGRMDPVQVYNSTKRNLQVGFTLYATSKEDFNEMWYKINKIVTLLYPQWTQGTKVSRTGMGDAFIQPFSQVLGASPIVRLRVGDVIKSNYSKFNLARMFGIGDPGINPTVEKDVYGIGAQAKFDTGYIGGVNIYQNVIMELFYAAMGTPLQYIPENSKIPGMGGRFLDMGLRTSRNFISSLLINGFVNPLGANLILDQLIDPNSRNSPNSINASITNVTTAINNAVGGLQSAISQTPLYGKKVKIKSNMIKGYLCDDNGQHYFIDRPIEGMVTGIVDNSSNLIEKRGSKKLITKKSIYKVTIIDVTQGNDLFNKTLFVDHQNIIPDIKQLFTTTVGGLFAIAEPRSLLDLLTNSVKDAAINLGIGTDVFETTDILAGTETERFMMKENNPFVRAYNSTAGRGLAGTVQSISFNWLEGDFQWDTDYNSRAPMGCQISFGFNVIHDLPPGIDHSGYNRAPIYNVGDIMKEISGDAHGDDSIPEFKYRKAGVKFKSGD